MKQKTILIIVLVVILASSCNLPEGAQIPEDVDSTIISHSTPLSNGDTTQSGEALPTQDEGEPSSQSEPNRIAQAGETLYTYIDSDRIGQIAVQVTLPETTRYTEGAGIVVEVNTFLTPQNRFYTSLDATAVGLIHVSYLWPGISDQGSISDGKFDYGGKISIQALRDVIRFASGEIPNSDGHFLDDLIGISPLYNNVGIYAFSHPGQAAINVMGLHGDQLSNVTYFVGRENPTLDKLTAVEVGHFDQNNRPVLNPLYQYPQNYSPRGIDLDYSSVLWDATYTEIGSNWVGVPYFDLNGNQMPDSSDYRLGLRVPAINDKRVYSAEMTKALQDNNAFNGNWPDDVAPLQLAKQTWSFQDSTRVYPDVGKNMPDLHIMLVFARYDHVQPAADKPHIHHAYDGFSRGANLWIRLNPDQSYVSWVSEQLGSGYSDHPANQQPDDWLEIESWGYSNQAGASQLIPLAAVAEMADRTQENIWDNDLSSVFFEYVFEKGE
jgi:hypothetical protein